MVKIIETNMNYVDFQSRIIEYPSWEDYVNIFKNYDSSKRYEANCYVGNMNGLIIPAQSKVSNLKYDDFHLSCDIRRFGGYNDNKYAYLIKE